MPGYLSDQAHDELAVQAATQVFQSAADAVTFERKFINEVIEHLFDDREIEFVDYYDRDETLLKVRLIIRDFSAYVGDHYGMTASEWMKCTSTDDFARLLISLICTNRLFDRYYDHKASEAASTVVLSDWVAEISPTDAVEPLTI